uniref:Uncharacterized protein n=1 Tax=Knipowitschia caucasica TaxID=637954 RepID=A0AAV2MNN7_KNICA
MEPTPRQLRAKRRREAAAGGLRVALLGLGLVCVLQAALNVGLRLYETYQTSQSTPASSTTEDPCQDCPCEVTETYQTSQSMPASFISKPCPSSYQGLCVHGQCRVLKDLDKPVCKGVLIKNETLKEQQNDSDTVEDDSSSD